MLLKSRSSLFADFGIGSGVIMVGAVEALTLHFYHISKPLTKVGGFFVGRWSY